MMNTSSPQRFMKINQAVLETKILVDRTRTGDGWCVIATMPLRLSLRCTKNLKCVFICASLSKNTPKPFILNINNQEYWKLLILEKLYCVGSPYTSESTRYSKLWNERSASGNCWYPPLSYNVLHPGFKRDKNVLYLLSVIRVLCLHNFFIVVAISY